MEAQRDEACALKVARALSYIDFSRLEKWYGELGFIKIFQGLKEEGSDLGWAVLLGSIECALSGDRHQPQEVIGRIIRDNRVTVRHLYDLYPDAAPVRPHPSGFRVHGICPPPEDALPGLGAAIRDFGEGALALDGLCDEMYRLHTPEMRDSLYFHSVLAAKSVGHPISAHMIWKAVRLLSAGSLPEEITDAAIARLESSQREHLTTALRMDLRKQSAVLEQFSPPVPEGAVALQAALAATQSPVGTFRERAAAFLTKRQIPEHRRRLSRFAELSGYEDGHIEALLQPFLLRCYSSEDEHSREPDLMVAVGPPEVEMPQMLEGIARGFGLPCMHATYGEHSSGWRGEAENELLRTFARARQLGEKSHGLPTMLVFEDGAARGGGRHGAGEEATAGEVINALCGLLTGPRRTEALGEAARAPVITVATAHTQSVVRPLLRDRVTVLRFELPTAPELERSLVRMVVGRYFICDLEGISFPALAAEAVGLTPGELDSAGKSAKLFALDRRSRELGTRLFTASQRVRARILESYLITQEDLARAIAAEKRAKGQKPDMNPPASAAAPERPARQTDLTRWSSGNGGRAGPWRVRP